jgi:hypothetical protein
VLQQLTLLNPNSPPFVLSPESPDVVWSIHIQYLNNDITTTFVITREHPSQQQSM